ncbi:MULTISPECIES: YraN family protein [unclassified Blautia]|uniref:YraN family protein n=1 Tax=unclassified Blautia TaxID=2648079 RepID=UPI000B396D1B|nr:MULTISPECIES: YraN family protein [unclassified Blautia]OUN31394.1 YraN family protein [Blautia sp. An81]OUN93402.1 YraN family protein [Blautia sp. An46]HJD35500.1 YraN family protein [Candidatus Blautia ornithocaccae]
MTGGRKGPDSSKKIGSRYEQAAADFLQDRGYKILERNFRCPAGEIDIIAREGEYLCFLEVKFRSEKDRGTPQEAVNGRKQRRISRAALYYMMKNGLSDTTPCRFDVVGILPEKTTLIKNAFSFKR